MDKWSTSVVEQLQGVQAVLDPETSTVSLISTATGSKPIKLKSQIRLFNQDGSVLDMSQSMSFVGGNYIDYNQSMVKPSPSQITA
mmetsp:Transcript_6224/g.8314  ORF Transcript_6224/g.8314 Transcript_6224/m.8314 type:complete len:85 (-) Transcript_6224:319-573(-)